MIPWDVCLKGGQDRKWVCFCIVKCEEEGEGSLATGHVVALSVSAPPGGSMRNCTVCGEKNQQKHAQKTPNTTKPNLQLNKIALKCGRFPVPGSALPREQEAWEHNLLHQTCFLLAQEVFAQGTQVKEGKNSALSMASIRHLTFPEMIQSMELVHPEKSPSTRRNFWLYLFLTNAGYSAFD